jgi:maltose O-acetyltransferase
MFYENIKIGDNSVIGRNCHLLGNITIKNNVSITADTYIFSSSHYKDSPIFEAYTRPVIIEDYAWIGARAMILPGLIIGKGAILGAASTATKNIPDYEVHTGAPAKKVAVRSEKLSYNLNYFPYFQ